MHVRGIEHGLTASVSCLPVFFQSGLRIFHLFFEHDRHEDYFGGLFPKLDLLLRVFVPGAEFVGFSRSNEF